MNELRLKGNEAFGQQRFGDAIGLYRQALAVYDELKKTNATTPLIEDEAAKCVGNLCLCLQKERHWEDLGDEARNGLRRNPLIAKAHCFLAMSIVELESTSSSLQAGNATVQSPSFTSSFDALMHLAIGCKLQPSVVTPALKESVVKAVEMLPRVRDGGDCKVSGRFLPGCCEARDTFSSGRGVFATAPIPSGTVVSPPSKPFAVTYTSDQGPGSICHSCGIPAAQESPFTIICSRCRHVAFCSDDCFATYLHRHATHECNLFVRLAEIVSKIEERNLDVPDEFAELARHTIATLSGLRSSPPPVRSELLKLEAHAAEVSQSLTPVAPLMHELIEDEDPSLLTTLVGIVRCNSFAVADATGLLLGQALHVGSITSLFNHSCAPNCTIDASQAIVTIRAVAADEQLTISYIPQLYWPAKLRRDGLEERYFFRCRCNRCEPTSSQTARIDNDAGKNAYDQSCTLARSSCTRACPTEYHHQIVQNVCGAIRMRPINEVSESDAKELEELLQSTLVDLPEHHYLIQDIRNCMTFVYSVLGNEEKVFANALEELLTWECIVPGLHPVKVAKLRNAMLALGDKDAGLWQGTLGAQLFGSTLTALAARYLVDE